MWDAISQFIGYGGWIFAVAIVGFIFDSIGQRKPNNYGYQKRGTK